MAGPELRARTDRRARPGQPLRLRAGFGPLDDAGPGFDRATFIDEGIFVAGRLAVVAVPLQR